MANIFTPKGEIIATAWRRGEMVTVVNAWETIITAMVRPELDMASLTAVFVTGTGEAHWAFTDWRRPNAAPTRTTWTTRTENMRVIETTHEVGEVLAIIASNLDNDFPPLNFVKGAPVV